MTDQPLRIDPCDAVRVRAFLDGWDAAVKCMWDTLSWVPDDNLVAVIRGTAPRKAS